VEERSEHLGEPRPEYGHCTNAVCLVGRREKTRGLFMDRRAFLVSYDPERDPRDEALARIDRINYDIWHAEGWCGRLDLAQKLAHKVNCRETVAEAIILPVEIRTF
jgi:hypothetical protein